MGPGCGGRTGEGGEGGGRMAGALAVLHTENVA